MLILGAWVMLLGVVPATALWHEFQMRRAATAPLAGTGLPGREA